MNDQLLTRRQTVNPNDRLIDRKTTMQLLSVSRSSTYRLCASGHLRPVKIGAGRTIRFRLSDVMALVESSQDEK